MADGEGDTAEAGRPRVLVVEDEPLIRHVISEFLGDDFSVVACESCEEAMHEIADGAPVEAALLDIDLETPGAGYAVARRARESQPDLVVVYTSGGSQTRFSQEKVAGSLFVPKPYAPERLCGLIRDEIERRRG